MLEVAKQECEPISHALLAPLSVQRAQIDLSSQLQSLGASAQLCHFPLGGSKNAGKFLALK